MAHLDLTYVTNCCYIIAHVCLAAVISALLNWAKCISIALNQEI